MTRLHRAAWLALMTLLTVAWAAACDKNDDDDDGGPSGQYEVSFTPESEPGDGDIWLELDEVDAKDQTFTLKVVGASLTAYGVAGRLSFDRNVCQLDAGAAGTALAGDGVTLIGAATGNDLGGVFGFSRSVDFKHSAALSSDQAVGVLTFRIIGKGETPIAFVDKRSSVMDHGLDTVEVAHWLGGTLTIK
jgi:hypothetical protein